MNVTDNDSAPSAAAGHDEQHPTARQRQRRGPMFGCLRVFTRIGVALVLFVAVIAIAVYWYLGTTSFADLVRLRIQATLESRLGRKVSIREVVISRGRQQKIILNDLRIANAPGGMHPYFATVKQLVITGGIDSFWGRKIKVGRIEVIGPTLNFEVFPAGSPLVHNFPHWTAGPKSRFEIYHLDLGTMLVSGGAFEFLDRRHDIAMTSTGLSSEIQVTSAEDIYAGVAASPAVHVRIQDYVPFDVALRGGFRYTPNVLVLNSIALSGRNMQLYLNGRLDPLADGVYNLHVTSEVGLDRVREIFKINKVLGGTMALDGNLRGRQGTFTLAGGWVSAKMRADAYELADLKGKLDVTDKHATFDVDTAHYGGGTIGAHYVLTGYDAPYPMSADLRYNGVSVEKLFNDWGLTATGLRGGATGKLSIKWNKDQILEGSGRGSATLAKNALAFSDAKYPIAIAGTTDFTLDKGVINFQRLDLATDQSQIGIKGTLGIDKLLAKWIVDIHSNDFAELDRVAYNMAHSAGKKSYSLLGLGGSGDISGTVNGILKTPDVVATIKSRATKYNDVVLGDGDLSLEYQGSKSLLTFTRATFRDGKAQLGLSGTVAFPDNGPSPRFDLAVNASGYPIDRAVATVSLKLAIQGLGTGRLIVTGTPDEGKVTFLNLLVDQSRGSELRLNGDLAWSPGKGNVHFALDIGARSFPVADIVTFLDLGAVQVSGDLTGTLHLEGPKSALEGAGAIAVRNGSVYGEAVNVVTADIAFTHGTLNATNISVQAPAGELKGELQLDLNTNKFTYHIQSGAIDLSKLKLLSSIAGLVGGNMKLTSTGAGTFEQPELVLEATLNQATVRGLILPQDAPPPTIYVAIRNGKLIIRGSAANALTIEGDGTIGTDYTIDGNVKVVISDIAKLLAMSPQMASLPASGNLELDARLGGKLSSIEALTVDGSLTAFNLTISDHALKAPQPPRFTLRNGRLSFDQFALSGAGSTFDMTGYADLTGDKRLDLALRGRAEAALLQLLVPGLRADGHINLAAGLTGTISKPALTGTAELENAQFRFPGFPQLIDHINGTLIFQSDRVKIDSLRADVGGGSIVAGGYIATDGLKPKQARITVQGTDVAIRYFEGVTVAGDFDLVISGGVDRAMVTGDVEVTRALYSKDFDFRTSLLNVILSRRGVTPIVAASWQDRVDLRLHLVATNTLAVRNNIADVNGTAELDVNGTLANPVVIGLVTLNEGGTVRFQGVNYSIVRGTINFQNPFRIDPYFDITLEGRVSGGFEEIESGSGPILVTVNLTGTLDRFTPSITSDPPASDITLFSLLGFGSLTGSRSGGSASASDAALAGRSLLYQNVVSAIGQKILPFADTFSFDPGLLDTTGDPGPKVTFEKRVSANIDVLVIYNLRDQHNRELIEWTINPEWTLQFTRDEITKEYRVEARFHRRYEGRWMLFGRRGAEFASFGSVSNALKAPRNPPPAEPAVPATLPGGSIPAGRLVTRIDFHADGAFDTSVLPQYVALRVGQPVTVRAVQSSIKSLFATGDFRDIRVDSSPSGSGVVITFALFLNYRVSEIAFDGLRGSDRDRAEHELTVHIGDILSLNAVDRSAVAVEDFLKRNGWLESTVDPETQFVRERSQAGITFHITIGPRARVGAVQIEGDPAPFTSETLIRTMRRGPGKVFTVSDARGDEYRMKVYMLRRDYRKATVRYLGYTFDPKVKKVTLRYQLNVGPKVRVDVTGVPQKAVRGAIPFRRNQAYSEDVVDASADAIVKLYQQRGYFNAAVDTEEGLVNGVWVITFHVKEGQQFRLTVVTFTGNHKIAAKVLRKVIVTAPSGGFGSLMATLFRRPTGVTRAQVNDDRDALESYYRINGFSEAKVDTPVPVTHPNGTITVDFPITEGPQTIVTDIHAEGNKQVPTKDLPKPQLHAGKPFNPTLERADVVALQTFYGDRGNAEAQVTPRVDVSPDKTTARLTYVIAEGPRVRIGEVVVRGNNYTRPKVVLRTADLRPGHPFSYTAILEAQRNLYRLGIFQRVEIQPEQAGTNVEARNVTIQVEEGKDLTVSGSVGMSKSSGASLSPLGSVSIAHRNLFGTGRYLGLELVGGNHRRDVFLTFREPFVFNYNFPVQFTVFQNDELRRGAHIRERGIFVEASKVYQQTRWSLRYEYRLGQCVIEKANDVCALAAEALLPGFDRSVTNIKISSITPTFFWDHRDDALDPHRGFLTSASVEYAFPLARADADFVKEFGQAAYYLPVSARSVFAVSGRFGLIQALGNHAETLVPLSERFTAGGETSQRAFPLDLLGSTCADQRDFRNGQCTPTLVELPGNTVAPVGGKSLVLFNAEYRFPIVGTFGAAVFADVGNVFAMTRPEIHDLRYGIGTGIRYLSPVGPLRIDIGFNPHRHILRFDDNNRAVYERPFAYFVTLGHAF
jgi:outer membrane protein insertion porin family